MSRPRRRLFGPLFYSTLVIAALVTVYTAILNSKLDPSSQVLDEGQEMKALIADLRAADPAARERAVRLIGAKWGWRNPTEIVPGLVAAAGDQREEVRIEVARGLGQVARYRLMVSGTQSAAGTVGGLDTALRDDAIRTLRRLLKDSSTLARAEAASALGEFGPDPAASADLTAAADDDDRAVRLAAARSLLKLNGPDDRVAARVLIPLVADPDAIPDRAEVLQAVKTASEALQDRAVTALVGLLSRAEPDVLPDVITSLPQAGPRARSAVPALEALLEHAEPSIRAGAAMAIVAIEAPQDLQGGPNAPFAGMGGAAGGGGMMSAMALGVGPGGAAPSPATGGHANPKVVAILARIVTDPKIPPEIRMNALGMIHGADAPALSKTSAGLARQLADPDPNVRRTAIELLSQIIEVAPVELPVTPRAK